MGSHADWHPMNLASLNGIHFIFLFPFVCFLAVSIAFVVSRASKTISFELIVS